MLHAVTVGTLVMGTALLCLSVWLNRLGFAVAGSLVLVIGVLCATIYDFIAQRRA